MAYTSAWTGGYDLLASSVTFSVDHELSASEKKIVICATASAASKTLTLGLDEGEVIILINVGGTNAFTAKNVEGDTGTSIATGKVALIIGHKTADASVVKVLN